jgi:ribose transport system substrate-binding protein
VKISAPSKTNDAEDQINLLDVELDSNPNAIIISLIDAEACEVQFDLASENGIPIITMDSGTAYGGIATTCSTDNEAAATKATKELSNMIDDEGQIVLMIHDSISETAQQRESAIKKEIEEKHPNIEIVETLHGNDLDEFKERIAEERNGVTEENQTEASVEENQEDTTGAEDEEDSGAVKAEDISDEEVITWLLDKYPDLKGVLATDGEMVRLLCSDTEHEEQVKNMAVVGFDAGKDQLTRLEEGWVDGLIVQNPYGMGYASVVAAARTILGESNESVVDTGYVWVTPDNMTNQEIANVLYE